MYIHWDTCSNIYRLGQVGHRTVMSVHIIQVFRSVPLALGYPIQVSVHEVYCEWVLGNVRTYMYFVIHLVHVLQLYSSRNWLVPMYLATVTCDDHTSTRGFLGVVFPSVSLLDCGLLLHVPLGIS